MGRSILAFRKLSSLLELPYPSVSKKIHLTGPIRNLFKSSWTQLLGPGTCTVTYVGTKLLHPRYQCWDKVTAPSVPVLGISYRTLGTSVGTKLPQPRYQCWEKVYPACCSCTPTKITTPRQWKHHQAPQDSSK